MNIKTITHLVAIGLASSVSAGYAAVQTVDTCIAAIQKQKQGDFVN